jgi:hypothetical protein
MHNYFINEMPLEDTEYARLETEARNQIRERERERQHIILATYLVGNSLMREIIVANILSAGLSRPPDNLLRNQYNDD